MIERGFSKARAHVGLPLMETQGTEAFWNFLFNRQTQGGSQETRQLLDVPKELPWVKGQNK